jgi:ribosomal protein S18 acetylase RimI-like enzyme
MMDVRFTVRPAVAADVERVIALLNDAAAWLLERGVEQWHPGQWRTERIAGAIARGETYLMFAQDRAIATASLEWSDELMWPDAAVDAGYVHRLAVARAHHGTDVGRILLTWTEWTIAKRPRRFARLDCACNNPALRAYYERAGYRHVDDRTVRGRLGDEYCGSRYEKTVL